MDQWSTLWYDYGMPNQSHKKEAANSTELYSKEANLMTILTGYPYITFTLKTP
jgi:hypothetical protein